MRLIISVVVVVAMFAFLPNSSAVDKQKPPEVITDFPVEKDELATSGRNDYFILEPGYFQVLESGAETLSIVVMKETKKIGEFEVRVVEEKLTVNGKLVEHNRSYFAISKKNKNVYYFGMDVDVYEDGKIKGHEGTWQHGMNNAKFGLIMPGKIVLKAKYQQEQAPNVAMDQGENLSVTETVETPAGTFKNCLKVEETSPLDATHRAIKLYAPGVGLVQDIEFKLTKHGFTK
jgi:hypothetical protein